MSSVLIPTENQEASAFAAWLRARGLLFCHVPNEGLGRTRAQGALLKSMGMSAGVPDFLVFERVPEDYKARGVAIEMKRRVGGKVSPEQKRWIADLSARGWLATVCRGAKEAIDYMRSLGF